MYKIIWMMLLVLINGNAIAGWTKIMDATEGSDQGVFFSVYTDIDTMHNSNDVIKVWELYDYKTVQSEKDTKPYLSLMARTEYDCSKERSREHYIAIFSENMGKGNRGGNADHIHSWESLVPGTVGMELLKFVCGK